MDTHDLLFVEKLSSEESLTSAAEHLFVTQSGLSSILAKVEHELGYQLFERGRGKKPLLTEQGKKALDLIRVILSAEEQLKHLAPDTRKIRVGLHPDLAYKLTACLIQSGYYDLFEKYSLLDSSYDQIEASLSSGELDLGIVRLPAKECVSSITIATAPFAVTLSTEAEEALQGRMAKDGSLLLEDIRSLDLILPADGSRGGRILRKLLESKNVLFSQYIPVMGNSQRMAMALSGGYNVLCAMSVLTERPRHHLLRDCEGGFSYVLARSKNYPEKSFNDVAADLKEFFLNHPISS